MEKTAAEAVLLFLANQNPGVLITIILASLGSPLAVTIMVLLSWRKSDQRQAALLETYRSDMARVLEGYGKDVAQLARYYESNVKLVESWEKIAEGFQTTVVLNTQAMTKVCDRIETIHSCVLGGLHKPTGR